MKSLSNNRCGSCALCCLIPVVPEIAKPINFWCAFCDTVTGCKIYNTRPQSCRTYFCLWYVNPQMPITLRPDMCGVIFEKLVDGHTYLALVDPKREYAWKEAQVLAVITQLNKQGFSVVATSGMDKSNNTFLAPGKNLENLKADIIHTLKMANNKIESQNGNASLYN